MNRSDTFLESCEPEGFEHEMMIAGKMIFDPIRGRLLTGGVHFIITFDAFGIGEMEGL